MSAGFIPMRGGSEEMNARHWTRDPRPSTATSERQGL